ncbi:MAG: leucine-rich repeat domain-containing protein [Desulfobacteraceae bacterium]|nr:leucine-rich repeat domain-containing protein [Desulfobacteraceae bacterium]
MYLYLSSNQITDLGPITGLTDLRRLLLYYEYLNEGNPLDETSCNVYIPQFESAGVDVEHNCP